MISRGTGKTILMMAAVAAWACGTAVAQMPGGAPQPSSPSQQQQMPGQTGGAGSPGATTGMPDTTQQQGQTAYGDQMFVHDALEGDDAQVAMSQLAAQKSSSSDVKQFSAKMVQVHSELNTQLKPAAKELGVSEPKGPSKKEQKEIDQLQALNGPDFDTAYIQAMAKQQKHDLKAFKDEAQGGQAQNVQQTAKQDEPILEQHYEVLQKLAAAHNVTLESKK